MIHGFGFNGFKQLIFRDQANTSTESVLTPLELTVKVKPTTHRGDRLDQFDAPQTPENETRATEEQRSVESEGEFGPYHVKKVNVSWDSIMYIFEDGRFMISGFHSDVTADDLKHAVYTSGCLSWSHIAIRDNEGRVSLKDLNKAKSTWNQVKLNEGEHFLDLDEAKTIEEITAGGKHLFVVTDSRRIASIVFDESLPILRPLGLNVAIKEISCGNEHTLLLSRIGVVFSMGIGGQGQLGHGGIETLNSPRAIEALEAVSMVTVAAGGWHSVAVSDIGDVYTWGWNERGQLGLPSKIVREEVDKLQGTTDVSHGVTPDVKEFQSLKASADELVNILTLPAVLDLGDVDINVSKVSCGSRHTAAIIDSGDVYTWGWNKYGQLGHGDKRCRDEPTLVTYFSENDLAVTHVYCGAWTTVTFSEKKTT